MSTVNPLQIPPVQTGTLSGSNIPVDSQPINKWDWFRLSRDWVFKSEERLKNQVDAIQSAIKWFFTLITGATIIGFSFKDKEWSDNSLQLYGLALLLLLLSYVIAAFAIISVSKTLTNPNSSNEISQAFNKANKYSKVFITISSIFLILGMGLFPVAIVKSNHKSPEIKPSLARLTAAPIFGRGNEQNQMTGVDISGYSPDSSKLRFTLSIGNTIQSVSVLDTFSHVIDHSNFDFFYRLQSPVKITKQHIYLSLIYRQGPDSISIKSVLINP